MIVSQCVYSGHIMRENGKLRKFIERKVKGAQ